ncbi:MAG TPA: hypothetical protein VNX86_04775 [Rhizomicrobium sp.]|jgi:hypothetical protein|nr:hypothetical protein [Rhizomicrobium sp.]
MKRTWWIAAALAAGALCAPVHAACVPDAGGPGQTCPAIATYLHNGVPQQVDDGAHPMPSGAQPTKGTGAYAPATVGTTDSTILAASTAAVFLDLVNNSSSATICVNIGTTATINGSQPYCPAGEITLPPLWHRSWDGTFVPTDAIHAIASATSTAATVGAK